ncbi:serine hydrolase domain-containing protein [Ruicaihuangia caeni]|uniref:Serine hydrolase domain-containing protein n=1 Tax=Ruicaihuangia caeni TaxID=3042517 RepID=A0AAW6T4C1_9MICO|nr:serine hydrolase domain-containing protein [Klugiella sp. YN-L-19]MDI2098676.1 serine hydrolase domain-containing protein [Klugiella sp. YN-L-19]
MPIGTRGPAGAVVGVANSAGSAVVARGTRLPSGGGQEPGGEGYGRGGDDPTGGGAPPMLDVTPFDLASVTKVVTTAAVMTLAGEGLLHLDRPVRSILPQFRGAGKDDITPRLLLQHRAGMWEWWPLYCEAREPRHAVLQLPLRYEPGREHRYSDLGFMVLGMVIEQVTGDGLPQALDALVLRPLGMTGTAFVLDEMRRDAAASAFGDAAEQTMLRTRNPYPVPYDDTSFGGWRERLFVGEANDGNAFHAFGGAAGHAGLFAPISDLLTLGRELLHEDPWCGATVRDAFISAGPDETQALGLRRRTIDETGVEVLWHPGFTGTSLTLVPSLHLVVAVGTNRLLHAPEVEPLSHDELWRPVGRALATTHAEAVR